MLCGMMCPRHPGAYLSPLLLRVGAGCVLSMMSFTLNTSAVVPWTPGQISSRLAARFRYFAMLSLAISTAA
jgi:hypothetical protein